MKIKIAAIGKLKSGPEQELFTRYLKRSRQLGSQLGFSQILLHEFTESKNPVLIARKQQEAELLLSTAKTNSTLIAFDENGKDITSQQFAALLKNERDEGTNELVFALGGPDGFADEMLGKAKISIRFGKMTWPHQLARILLIEQLYRATTILCAHPYHRQ